MGKKKPAPFPSTPLTTPLIVVACRCYDNGEFQSEQFLMFASVPRVGEFVTPDKGSGLLAVHAVVYRTYELPGSPKLLLPTLYLRELSKEDEAHLVKLKVQTD
jgi:hypothetical protein